MSLCVFLQDKDSILVGADTAWTLSLDNGKKARSTRKFDKLIKIADLLLFVCGDSSLVHSVLADFESSEGKEVTALQKIMRYRYQQYVEAHPQRLKELDLLGGESLLGIVVLTMSESGTTLAYALNSVNNFELEAREGADSGTFIMTGGYGSIEAFKHAESLFLSGIRPVRVIEKVFERMSGEYIGGDLVLYTISKSGIELLKRQPIRETLRIPVYEDTFGATLTGGIMTGALIRTAPVGQRIELSSSGNLLEATNGLGATFSILPSIVGTPGLQWANGTDQAQIMLQPGVMSINTANTPTHITVAAGRNVNLSPGSGYSVVIPHFDRVYSTGNLQSLGDRLADIESQISSLAGSVASLAGSVASLSSRVSALESAS